MDWRKAANSLKSLEAAVAAACWEKATCVFGAQQAGWKLSRRFPPILDEQHTTPLLRGSHRHHGKWGHGLPLYSHKNNVDNWEGTEDENDVRRTDRPALVDVCLDRV